jgi:uncharacterized protein (TIGR00730 family)
MPIISVFGSSAPRPGSADYELARQMGALLAEAGFTVQTGGYCGIMEAASRGASEAGGHVIGVTSSQIEEFRPTPPNQWVAEEIKYLTLRERLIHLVEKNDGAIVLSGGIGTLAELALSWSWLQVGEISPRPLIAVGGIWARTLNAFITPEYISSGHAALIQTAKTPKEALKILVEALED